MDESDFEIDPDAGVDGRSAMESGAAHWALGDDIPTLFELNDYATYRTQKLIARLEQAKPSPIAFHVRVSTENSPFDFDMMGGFPELTIGPAGVLIVDYGDLTGRHRLVADLHSGTYRLPACTFAQAYALQWNALSPMAFDLLVAGTFSRAADNMPKLYTMGGAGTIAAGDTATLRVPFYAQYVDIWATGWVGGIGAADAPILRADAVGLYRDYTTGLFVPPWGPVSLAGDSQTTDQITIENAGPAAVKVYCQFYLEP